MYQSWLGSVETFLDGATSGLSRNDPDRTRRIIDATSDAPESPFILKMLAYPIPGPATVENGGAIPFWAVVLQGIWLGVVGWSGFSRTNGMLLVLAAFPFAVLVLVSGNVLASLFLGALGPVIVSLVWWMLSPFAKPT
ncbi:MAG: hypothetical protein ACK5JT_15645 [Hyphomicrobiaceae bacterium]